MCSRKLSIATFMLKRQFQFSFLEVNSLFPAVMTDMTLSCVNCHSHLSDMKLILHSINICLVTGINILLLKHSFPLFPLQLEDYRSDGSARDSS